MTRPTCGTLTWPFGPMEKPKPSWPIRQPGWMITRSPISAWVIEALRADRAQSRPIRTSGPIAAPAPTIVPEPISARGPMTAPGSTVTPHLQPGRRMDRRRRAATAARLKQRRWPQRVGKQRARHRDKRAIGLACDQRGKARRRVLREALRRSGRRPPRVVASAARIFRIVEKGQVARPGAIERSDIADTRVGRAPYRAAWRPSVPRSRRLSGRWSP